MVDPSGCRQKSSCSPLALPRLHWLAPEGTALAIEEGVATAGASLEEGGAVAPVAFSLALCAAALWPGVPLTPAVLVMTLLLAELIVSLLFSSTFLQALVPNMSAVVVSTADA